MYANAATIHVVTGTKPVVLVATISNTAAWPIVQGKAIFRTLRTSARVLDMRWGVFTVTTMSRRARLPMDASRALDSRTAIPTVTGTTTTKVAMIFSAKTDSPPVKPLRNKGTPTAAVIATHTRTSNQSTSQAARRLHGCRFTIASLSAVRTGASRKPNPHRDSSRCPVDDPWVLAVHASDRQSALALHG